MIVNPAPDALVRDPASLLPIAAGASVDENDPYFARAIADGDLVAETAPSPAPRAPRGKDQPASTGEDNA